MSLDPSGPGRAYSDLAPLHRIAPGQVIKLETRFGGLSRGKCWGKHFPNRKTPTGEFQWVSKSSGTLYLEGPGYYIVGSSDGFRREARAEFYLAPSETKPTNSDDRDD